MQDMELQFPEHISDRKQPKFNPRFAITHNAPAPIQDKCMLADFLLAVLAISNSRVQLRVAVTQPMTSRTSPALSEVAVWDVLEDVSVRLFPLREA